MGLTCDSDNTGAYEVRGIEIWSQLVSRDGHMITSQRRNSAIPKPSRSRPRTTTVKRPLQDAIEDMLMFLREHSLNLATSSRSLNEDRSQITNP